MTAKIVYIKEQSNIISTLFF